MDATNYKVLLLLDIDSCIFYDDRKNCAPGTSVNTIRVSALKLLHFYLCRANSNNIQFQWAYKIYTQDKKNIQNVKRQSCFQDLNLQSFEAFESSLETDYSFLTCNEDTCTDDDPCDLLGEALQDAVVFFPWTISEIQSPKRRRSHKQKEPVKHETGNLVFLFSFCPRTVAEVKRFAGKTIRKANALLESFATTELQRKIADLCCVTFVDLNNGVNNSDGVLMKEALSVISGRLLPVSSLMCLGTEQTCHISNFLPQKDQTFSVGLDTPVYPVSTTLTSYFYSVKNAGSISCKLFNGWRNSCIDIDIVSTVNNRGDLLLAAVSGRDHPKNATVEVFSVSSTKCDEAHESTSSISVYKKDSLERTTTSEEISMKVVGVLLGDSKQFTTEEMYMVTPHKACLDTYITQMAKFTRHHMILVCEICVNETSVLSALLQPLTLSSALLSILPGLDQITQGLGHMTHHGLESLMIPLSSEATCVQEISEFIRKSVEQITQRKMLPDVKPHHGEQGQCVSEGDRFSTGLLEDYFIPGSLSSGAQHLHSIIQSDTEVSVEEADTMRLLQKNYMRHKARRLTDKKPTRTSPRKPFRNKSKSSNELSGEKATPMLRRSPRKKPSSLVTSEDKVTKPMLPPPVLPPKHPLRRSRSHTAPTRSDILWNKCRENIAKQKQKDSSNDAPTKKPDTQKTAPAASSTTVTEELQTKEALREYLEHSYEDTLELSTGVLSCVHTLLNITLHFTQTHCKENPQKAACDIMGGSLIKTVKEIKAKNQGQEDKTFRECELQVSLQMELQTMLRDGRTEEELEQTAEQVAALLRAMSFSDHSGFNVADYLDKYLLDNYIESLPLLLGKIYEEFLLPLPPQLETLLSPEVCAVSSVSSTHIPGSVCPSVGSNSSELPPSNRPRRDKALKRYTSFHTVSSRQIQLPQQEKKKEKPRRSARTASTTKIKPMPSKVQGDVKKISKNLFGSSQSGGGKKLERSKSVAVMETQSVRKTPKKNSGSQKTPKVHHVLKSRRVTETPSHKQKSKSVWHQQEKARRRTLDNGAIQTTVEESPGKALVYANKKTPKKTPKKGALMKRKSFYSMTDNARNKFEKLEARMKNKILSPTWNDSRKFSKLTSCMTSPRRVHPRTLFSSLHSPSPKKPLTSLLLKTPDRKSTANSTHYVLDSPGFSTRSQTSGRKRLELESAPVESVTPRKKVKMNLFQSPPPGMVQPHFPSLGNVQMGMSQTQITPKKQLNLMFMSPAKQGGTCGKPSGLYFTDSSLPSFKKPHSILNSPGGVNIKGILSPAKRTPKKHSSLSFGSPLRCTPKKNVVLNLPESPFPVRPGEDILVENKKLKHSLTTAANYGLSNKLLISTATEKGQSITTVFQSPKPSSTSTLSDSSRPVTRSASKMYPGEKIESPHQTWKARANLSSLFSDDANDGFSNVTSKDNLENEKESFKNTEVSSRQSTMPQNVDTKSTDSCQSNSMEDCPIQRRTLSSRSKKLMERKKNPAGSQDKNMTEGLSFNLSAKRKLSPEIEDTWSSYSLRKRSRSSLYSEGIPQAEQNSQEYWASEEVFLESGRALEKPSTKSTLCSDDQSNSRMLADMSDHPTTCQKLLSGAVQLQDVTNSSNCEMNLSMKSLPAMYLNYKPESLDSVDSPIFSSGKQEELSEQDENSCMFLSGSPFSKIDQVTKSCEVTSLFKGVMNKNLQKTLSGQTDSSMSGAPSPVFNTSISSSNSNCKEIHHKSPIKNLESTHSHVNLQSERTPKSQSKLPKPNFVSPLKICQNSELDNKCEEYSQQLKSPSNGTTPRRMATRLVTSTTPPQGKSPQERHTPMCSPPGNGFSGSTKYSPLTSTRSLALLIESPLLANSGEKRKKKCMWDTSRSRDGGDGKELSHFEENNSGGTETRRQTRRSLYRTQTNQSLN